MSTRPWSSKVVKGANDRLYPADVEAAGDVIGASPLVSALYLDEPTIDAMNLLGLELSSVGNHEFDKGTRELTRIQRGGCEIEQ